MKNKIDKIVELLQRNGSVYIYGHRDVPTEILKLALKELIENDVDILTPYYRISRLLDEQQYGTYSDEDYEFAESFLDGNEYFEPLEVLEQYEYENILECFIYTEHQRDYKKSYEYKRRVEYSRHLRASVVKRDVSCLKCGSFQDLEVDHIKPLIEGGDNTLENLQLLCHSCHMIKHHGERS